MYMCVSYLILSEWVSIYFFSEPWCNILRVHFDKMTANNAYLLVHAAYTGVTRCSSFTILKCILYLRVTKYVLTVTTCTCAPFKYCNLIPKYERMFWTSDPACAVVVRVLLSCSEIVFNEITYQCPWYRLLPTCWLSIFCLLSALHASVKICAHGDSLYLRTLQLTATWSRVFSDLSVSRHVLWFCIASVATTRVP